MNIDFSTIDLKDLACLIYETLKESNIKAVLVGGACVSIYSKNRYQSYDLDFVTYEGYKMIEQSLNKLGFKQKGRYFIHPNCPFFIDFVNPPVAVGYAPINHFTTLQTTFGSLQLLTPTDCVKDRLASYIHWNDAQAFEQALLVAQEHQINFEDIKNWAKNERGLEKFNKFMERLDSHKPL